MRARSPTFPRRVQAGPWLPRGGRCSATPERIIPPTGLEALASPELHAHRHPVRPRRPAEPRALAWAEHDQLVARCEGVEVLSHAGSGGDQPTHLTMHTTISATADRLSPAGHRGQPGRCPRPGQPGRPLKPGRIHPRVTPDEGRATPPICPQTRISFPQTAATWLTRRLQEHVGRFSRFLSAASMARHTKNRRLIAAKLMGRWRSGAPLTLAPEKDDPALGADPPNGNNDFNLQRNGSAWLRGALRLAHAPNESSRHGGEHKSADAMIRRGATYGSAILPEGAPEDRPWNEAIAAFVICGSLIRQFWSSCAKTFWGGTTGIFTSSATKRDPDHRRLRTARLRIQIPKRPDPGKKSPGLAGPSPR